MRTRIVIVGGGLAGLVAATDLARSGLRPVLLEAASKLGGRAQTRVVDGFCFNQGPHALYAAGALSAALHEFGVRANGGRPDIASGLSLWSDVAYPWPTRSAPGDASPPLDRSESGLLAGLLKRIATGDYDGQGQSLRAVTAAWPPNVRNVIEALVRLTSYAHAPDLMDAKAALDQVRLSLAGVLYIDGGWAGLVEGLAAIARKAGAELRTERRVWSVTKDEARWRVQIIGEPAICCDAVILAVPPSDAVQVTASKTLVATVSDLRPARIIGLDLGLSSGVSPRANFALGITAPTYMSVHSSAASLAPEGGTMASLARYLGPGETPEVGAINGLERLADTLLPGWRSREMRRQRLVALTASHNIRRWHNGGLGADSRLTNSPGVYLAGDWIGDGGMLADAATASARAAAAQARAFLGTLGPLPDRHPLGLRSDNEGRGA
jgi:hypothetical protein